MSRDPGEAARRFRSPGSHGLRRELGGAKHQATAAGDLFAFVTTALVILLLSRGSWAEDLAGDLPAGVRFNRDIRPLLATRCWHCHGPDSAARRGALRLDREDDAKADRGGYRVVAPGDPAASELMRRITSRDPDIRMPPAGEPRQLRDSEIELLRRWIEQGGRYERHWSFTAPRRPPLPDVRQMGWPRDPLDYFVLARLEAEGLRPAPAADRATLLRRLTLDLTGLPPTPAEVAAFLADPDPRAYERQVERLLGSPRYGERLALKWLDIARFADSGGYQGDILRSMWLWRDWVIDAYNRNLPFDAFTTEQLAGDLLAEEIQSDAQRRRIATGFHRNHRINDEDGIIPEEFRVEYVADRVETTAAAWLGLTIGCARCHDHKYDPIEQREYYRLFALFNSIDERGRGHGNAPPLLTVVPEELQRALDALDARMEARRQSLESPEAADDPVLKQLAEQRDRLLAGAPNLMVMRELPAPRPTQVLIRGAYDRPGARVEPGTPASIGPPFAGFAKNRLGLARWLLDRRHPLTARVAVNRYWRMLLGRGLVETPEDFGTQGQLPSHPELLDWLAVEFRESGWDVKGMLRRIVTSATYRQSSEGTAGLRARDPDNRLLARGGRFRLPAEALRDQALAAGGLLEGRIGGPSVRPYQPPGLWRELSSASRSYEQSRGADLYRRSLYTFIRRTIPPPSMNALDAPNREICLVRRPRTNTPLQALVLMNDPTWVEAARGLARRALRAAQGDDQTGLRHAFGLLLARRPTAEELRVLRESLAYYRSRYERAPEDADRLLAVGVSAPPGGGEPAPGGGEPAAEGGEPAAGLHGDRCRIPAGELAAWSAVCSLLLNLDETLTRE